MKHQVSALIRLGPPDPLGCSIMKLILHFEGRVKYHCGGAIQYWDQSAQS
jgi:hypothetical protein